MAKPNRSLPRLTRQDLKRFYAKIDRTEGQGPRGNCWEWKGARVKGYGVFKISHKADGIRVDLKASRIAYFLANGIDLRNSLACHHCDNPPCCRPGHLFNGSNWDNAQDSVAKGRRPRGDAHHWHTKPETLTFRGDNHWTRKDIERAREQFRRIPRAKGERQHSAKMTTALVLEARRRYGEGVTIYRLAKDYGIDWANMNKIIKRINWKHV